MMMEKNGLMPLCRFYGLMYLEKFFVCP